MAAADQAMYAAKRRRKSGQRLAAFFQDFCVGVAIFVLGYIAGGLR